LKMTIAQFFRVNGGTTQLRGVTPDIVFPAFSDAEQFGESSYGNALPWTQIKAADYLPIGDLKEQLPILVTLHKDRVKKDKDFQYLLEDISQSQVLREKNMVSLNEAERRKERDAQEVSQSSRELRMTMRKTARFEQSGNERPVEMSSSHLDDGLQANERNLANELAVEKARKSVKDVLLIEAVNIINDEVAVQNGRVKFAVRGKPASFSKPD
jgi:carboxyl-terminal processing protease